jgi:5'-nucleotidase
LIHLRRLKMRKATCDKASRGHTLIMALGLAVLAFSMLVSVAGAASSAGIPHSGSNSVSDFSKKSTIDVQILAINDLHGQLEPPSGTMVAGYYANGTAIRVPAGGVEYLATYIKNLSAENPNTFVVSAGDNIGASPLISALFHDEPTIKSLNMM